MPPASDIDVAIVVASPLPAMTVGKVRHQDVLLEISFVSAEALARPEVVLSTYYLAGSFRVDAVLCDPTGQLRGLQEQVGSLFAEQGWVLRRCQDARQRVESHLGRFDPLGPWHDQVTAWLFAAGVTTHILLVAALRNPTVRLRYLNVREVLQTYRHPDVYERLLDLLGCTNLAKERVERHLAALAITFDAASAVAKTPFPFSSDITPAARHIAIDGGEELIRASDHRESVFWTVATFARCHKILAVDGPRKRQHELMPAFDELMADLGIASTGDLIAGCRSISEALPMVWETAVSIVAANRDVFAGTGDA
ncbi:MAG TPA: hypothetical protein VF163_15800 [Micromonosporaceae bacterium]